MLKHLNKENLTTLFNALRNEPISEIIQNGINKVKGISKPVIISSPPRFTGIQDFGKIKLKIETVKIDQNNQTTIIAWILSEHAIDSVNIDNLEKNKIKSVKIKLPRLDVQQTFPNHVNSLYSGLEIILVDAEKLERLEFSIVDDHGTQEVGFNLNDFKDLGSVNTKVYTNFVNPNPKYYKRKTKSNFIPHEDDTKLITYFLPQFHQIPENDEWWGAGFTEWTNVTKALPKFEYHYQPRLPGELGFYDLSETKTLHKQTALAKAYGIHGFCFHYYWFSGQKLLEKPIENFLSDKSIDFKFCINWANENWTRTWDGAASSVLMKQDYDLKNAPKFYEEVRPLLKDQRYICEDGKPMILIYRPLDVPNLSEWIAVWRKMAKEDGFPDLQIIGCQSIEYIEDEEKLGLDAMVQFPPHHMSTYNETLRKHGYNFSPHIHNNPNIIFNQSFRGTVLNYSDISTCSYNTESPSREIEAVFPGWDNTARKSNVGTPFVFSNPIKYGNWLNNCLGRAKNKANNYVFVNAWNEWAEGAYLEPDRHFGFSYLEETAVALAYHSKNPDNKIAFAPDQITKSADIAIIIHLYYIEMWDELKVYLNQIEEKFDLYISIIKEKAHFEETIKNDFADAQVFKLENQGRDVGPFLEIMGRIKYLDYKYIAKLHSKKSPHANNGSDWRKYSFDSLIGSNRAVQQAIKTLESNPDVGVVCGISNIFSFKKWGLGSNAQPMKNLSFTLGLEKEFDALLKYCKENEKNIDEDFEDNLVSFNENRAVLDEEYIFPAGTMFWFKPLALQGLFELGWGCLDFPSEEGQLDGTMAHAIERMIGLICKSNGFKLKNID